MIGLLLNELKIERTKVEKTYRRRLIFDKSSRRKVEHSLSRKRKDLTFVKSEHKLGSDIVVLLIGLSL